MNYRIFIPVLTALGLVLSLALIAPVPGMADEVVWPVKCYEGDELQKVREWEKTWAGKRIDINNASGVKEYLLDKYYEIFTDPAWGGDYYFEILPYQQMIPSKGDIKLTRQYAPQCKVGENDELLNYVSGYPFPNPKTGHEIAYNFDNINSGDNMFAYMNAWIIDGKRKYNRYMALNGWMLWFSGRREVEPVPDITPNKKGIYRGGSSEYVTPATMKGTLAMNLKWKDRSRDWASYSFSSATRRITRRSNAQRQSSLGGTDVVGDDDWGYSWSMAACNIKLTGRKELLAVRHQDLDRLMKEAIEGRCLMYAKQRERINTYVLEVTRKDSDYIYGKQIWYVDPESWWILQCEKFDKRMRYWKWFEMCTWVKVSEYNGEKIPHMAFQHVIDVQRMHATGTPSDCSIGIIDKKLSPEYFEPRALLKWGY